MYLDDVVISGIIILVLTCVFLVFVGWFAWRHIRQDLANSDKATSKTIGNS